MNIFRKNDFVGKEIKLMVLPFNCINCRIIQKHYPLFRFNFCTRDSQVQTDSNGDI